MKRMNNLKNLIAAKIMGGHRLLYLHRVRKQNASVRKNAHRIPSMRNVRYAFMITMSARVWTHI